MGKRKYIYLVVSSGDPGTEPGEFMVVDSDLGPVLSLIVANIDDLGGSASYVNAVRLGVFDTDRLDGYEGRLWLATRLEDVLNRADEIAGELGEEEENVRNAAEVALKRVERGG